jgi:S-formylglutathione hydrolase FrmB
MILSGILKHDGSDCLCDIDHVLQFKISILMRAKFYVNSIENHTSTDGTLHGQTAYLTAVYAGETNAEDNQFAAATPSGSPQMYISNPNAFGFLEEGSSYYLDFTKASKVF